MKVDTLNTEQIQSAAVGRLDLIAYRAMEVKSLSKQWLLGGGVCGI